MSFGRVEALGRAALPLERMYGPVEPVEVAVAVYCLALLEVIRGVIFGSRSACLLREGKRQKLPTRLAFTAGLHAPHVRVGAEGAAMADFRMFAVATGIGVKFLGKESIFIKHGDFLRVGTDGLKNIRTVYYYTLFMLFCKLTVRAWRGRCGISLQLLGRGAGSGR